MIKKDHLIACITDNGYDLTKGRAYTALTDVSRGVVQVLNDGGKPMYYSVSLFTGIEPQFPKPLTVEDATRVVPLYPSGSFNVPEGGQRKLRAFADLLVLEAAMNKGCKGFYTFGLRGVTNEPVAFAIHPRDNDPTYRLPIYLADHADAVYLTQHFAETIKVLFS